MISRYLIYSIVLFFLSCNEKKKEYKKTNVNKSILLVNNPGNGLNFKLKLEEFLRKEYCFNKNTLIYIYV